MNNYELYHHGTKNMKWGQRRYQNKDGSLTPLGRIHYGIGKARDRGVSALTKLKIQRKAAAKAKASGKALSKGKPIMRKPVKKSKAQLEKERLAKLEADKKRVLASRSAEEIFKNAHLFTTDELKEAKFRLELERDIKNLAPAKVSKGEQAVNKITKAGENVNKLMKTGIPLWNNIASIHNSLTDSGRENPWPVIKEKGDKSMTKAAKAENEKNIKSNLEFNKAMRDKKRNEAEAAKTLARLKRQQAEDLAKDYKQARKDKSKEAKRETKEAKREAKEANKAAKEAEKAAKKAEEASKQASKPFSGTVEGDGRSKATKFFEDDVEDFVEGIFKDLSAASASNSPLKQIGQNYITYLLEDKRRR